jgi:hypothetical protein
MPWDHMLKLALLWSWVSLILNRLVDKKEFSSFEPFSFEFYDKAKVMTIHKKI